MEQHDQQVETSQEEAGQHQRPRWIQAVIAAGIIAAAIYVTVELLGGADHGPGRHQSDQPAETITGHSPPIDHG